jgi:hypothetical protein
MLSHWEANLEEAMKHQRTGIHRALLTSDFFRDSRQNRKKMKASVKQSARVGVIVRNALAR